MSDNIRNIAIIAHVDHGKTTLVDAMLHQSGIFRSNQVITDRIMDSNDLEKERGITILSKNLSINYQDVKINIVDTPGHADFGGEVERVLKMVDSVLLLVDAFDGPMPQTRFVLKKSLDLGIKPIVVINKIDRPGARPEKIVDMVFDLFCELDASEDQLDFPIVYASAKNGYARYEPNSDNMDLEPLFETIKNKVPSPDVDVNAPFQFLATSIDYNNYIGRIATGKIFNGSVKNGETIARINKDGKITRGRISKLIGYQGMQQITIEEAFAGEVVTIAGFEDISISETLAATDDPQPLPYVNIDEPTLSMNFMVNSSPFAGTEGKLVTSRNISERLQKELRTNVSLRVENTDSTDTFKVSGRGELHLSILIETMRREGFELAVSKPEVIFKEENGQRVEPIEYLCIDVPEEFQGTIIEKLGKRKAEMISMNPMDGNNRLEFNIPARGLIGFRTEFMTDTRGTGVLSHSFLEYAPFKGEIEGRKNGVLISIDAGESVAYSLFNLQDRGVLFINPATKVYEGMIIGQNAKESDMMVNVRKGKKLSNVRSSGTDEAIRLTPPNILTLEQALEYIAADELVEITPDSIRLRKKILDANERKKSEKNKSA
ncbi:MAG: translational GTPase TypA [Thermodesulfobacteriota bacterium]|nr:translational GTPase TypA [Thermodesulfobacteriota bacterium]